MLKYKNMTNKFDLNTELEKFMLVIENMRISRKLMINFDKNKIILYKYIKIFLDKNINKY